MFLKLQAMVQTVQTTEKRRFSDYNCKVEDLYTLLEISRRFIAKEIVQIKIETSQIRAHSAAQWTDITLSASQHQISIPYHSSKSVRQIAQILSARTDLLQPCRHCPKAHWSQSNAPKQVEVRTAFVSSTAQRSIPIARTRYPVEQHGPCSYQHSNMSLALLSCSRRET